MTPSGSTYSHKYVGADIAGLVIGGGPDVCVTQQAQSCNLILGAELRAGIPGAYFRRYLADRTELASRGALSGGGGHSRCALPH
jgi:hypothetical protein